MHRVLTPDVPACTRSEVQDAKRCLKKWYWTWRRGFVPRAKDFGALELGTWMHEALARWYIPGNRRANLPLHTWFVGVSAGEISAAKAEKVPDHIIDKAQELQALGIEMCKAYERAYRGDNIEVLGTEVPLDFTFSSDQGHLVKWKFKPDGLIIDHDVSARDVWVLEHKTASTIRTEHLALDTQAKGYPAMAERSLRKAGILKRHHRFKGILYNFLRKALPDSRPKNKAGQYLNQDGTVSKKQPPPYFKRHPLTLTTRAKIIALQRMQKDALWVTMLADDVRKGLINADTLPKTPHHSCPKTCDFFAMCVAEDEGADISNMQRIMFVRRNPYLYHEENQSTDDRPGFEMG